MKRYNILTLLVGTLLFYNCAPTYYYQVFSAKAQEPGNQIQVENEDLKIDFDLWEVNGKVGLSIYNKSEAPLYVDFRQCALTINGVAHPVYSETTTSTSVTSVNTRSVSYINIFGFLETPANAKGSSLSNTVRSNPIAFVPAKAKITPYLPGALGKLYEGADTKLKRGEPKRVLPFRKENTPYVYRLTLGYSQDHDIQKMKFVEKEFWVESITVLKEEEFLGPAIRRVTTATNRKNPANYQQPYKKSNNFFAWWAEDNR
jgi:hypothetical protein